MAVRIDVRADFSGVLRDLDRLGDAVARPAVAAALNRTAEGVRTTATNHIFKAFNIRRGKVLERFRIRRAFAGGRLAAEVSVPTRFGRSFLNAISFGAKELKRGGVSVKIRRDSSARKGDSWFVITNRRTGGRFVARRVGQGRLAIRAVDTGDVPAMFLATDLQRKILARIARDFPKEVERRVRLALRGGRGR